MQYSYAVWDSEEGVLHQFVALDTTTAKQAVSSFIEANASALFGREPALKDTCLAEIEETCTLDELSELLKTKWALHLSSMLIQ